MATPANKFFNKLEGTWANKLDATWQNSLGWNFISQPRIEQAGPSDFMMRNDQMQETITFKRLGIARNVGVDGMAGFWDGMAYTIAIKNLDGEDIHQEMGHFLMQVKDKKVGDTHKSLEAPIIRQASIPRANAMMTPGTLFIQDVASAPDVYDAEPTTVDAALQEKIDIEFAKHQELLRDADGPDLTRPLDWLKNQHAGAASGTSDWVFDFHEDRNDLSMASGQRVGNPVGIGNLLSAFWIGDRSRNGGITEILQYAQKVDIRFNGIDWAHTAVNSLFKQP